jgi:hypothetical protein
VIWSTGLLITHAGFQVLMYPAMRDECLVLQVASYIDAASLVVERAAIGHGPG